jgi:uncharacterized membrane protein
MDLLAIILAVLAGVGWQQLRAIWRRLNASETALQGVRQELELLRAALPRADAGQPPVAEEPSTAQAQSETADRPDGHPSELEQGAPEEASVPAITASARDAAVPRIFTTSLEERLGTRWAVWVGGIALALGGLLLVRYSIEQGWFGPAARIVLGLLFSAGLIAAGEWFRRSERRLPIEPIPSAHIPSVLTAAGTASAFGTLYAAHALYGFIGPALAFILLGLVGIATMLAAALHGPALAGLGLAGSYVAPLLVSSAQPNPWPVVIYLAVVAAAGLALARVRRWLWLAALVVAGAFLWGVPFIEQMSGGEGDWTLAGYAHLLVQLVLAAAFIGIEPNIAVADEHAEPDRVSAAALGALAVVAIAMLAESRYGIGGMMIFAIATAAVLMATAWLAPVSAAAPIAALVVLAAIATWPGLTEPPPSTLLAPEVADVLRLPENVGTYLTFATLSAVGLAAVAGWRLWQGSVLQPPAAGLYVLAATATPLLALVIAYLRVTQFDRSIPFAFAGTLLGAAFAVVTERFSVRERQTPTSTATLVTGAFAAAAIAGLSFALVAILDRGYLTVALALAALGTAYVATLRDISLLRYAVTALGAVVLGRVLWDPVIMGADVGRLPILNWLLLGYGVPAAAFAASAVFLRTRGEDVSARLCQALAVVFTALLVYFQIRHALNEGDPLQPTSSHIEFGLFALTSLGFSYVLSRLDLARANPVFRYGSLIFGVLSGIIIVLGLGLFENPLLAGDRVLGVPVFSSLMLAYLAPGLMATLAARSARGVRPRWYVTGMAILASLLIFGYATLEVRHAFQGEFIGWLRSTDDPEKWAYSAVWLFLGLCFLAYGIWRESREARLASAVLVLLSVVKVFLLDLAGLTGPWRAFSFIVLGVVLIGIGLAYQKLVFARPQAGATQSQ